MKAAQDIQKSYADKHRVNRDFSVGDHFYLKVRERKSSLKLGSCAKLSIVQDYAPNNHRSRVTNILNHLHTIDF